MRIIMEQKFDPNDSNQEAGEEHLSILIKQAGNDARLHRREAMSRHFEKIRAVIRAMTPLFHESLRNRHFDTVYSSISISSSFPPAINLLNRIYI